MAGITLTFKTDFSESEIKAAIKSELQSMEPAINTAVHNSAGDAPEVIAKHIKSDVYAKWNPVEYERRYEDGLLSEAAVKIYPGTYSVEVDYEPSGASGQWERPASGDALIGRIESGIGYEWSPHPGARPFWENVVNELIDSVFGPAFDANMKTALGDSYEGPATVEREANDGVH